MLKTGSSNARKLGKPTMNFSASPRLDAVLLLFLALCGLRAACGNAEVKALMELKAAMDPESRVLSSWTHGLHPCDGGGFSGVACNDNRRVANISLQGKGLSGTISPAVALLKRLSGLYLHYNSLNGKIPPEMSQLTELVDVYLNFNNLSGNIPPEIGRMASLQVLELCYNRLGGQIPTQIASAKKLTVLALQHNGLSGAIPESVGHLEMLKRINLSFNHLAGAIPAGLAGISQLEVLDVQNNHLSGYVSPALRRLREGFLYGNNLGLCGGAGFPSLRNCASSEEDIAAFDVQGTAESPAEASSSEMGKPVAGTVDLRCNRAHCLRWPKIAAVAGSVLLSTALVAVALLVLLRRRLRKQKIGCSYGHAPERGGLQIEDPNKERSRRSPSSLAGLEYSDGWDPFGGGRNCKGLSQEFLERHRFDLEEIEDATRYFSEANLLRKGGFSSVYKGILRDGSAVAIRCLAATSCRSEEAGFAKGLSLLGSLKHDNLVRLRGFCCSSSRGECFLLYDFAANGNLSGYLDIGDGRLRVALDWSTRVSIITGIAKGISYLHENQPAMVHRNISAEKVLLDRQFNPLISDAGLTNLLADDVLFAALKTSAAMGYLAPEYVTTGRFTEKSDVYAFGVIILQVLSGTQLLPPSMRRAPESGASLEFIDPNLNGKFPESEAVELQKLGLVCTHEVPDQRPRAGEIVQKIAQVCCS